MLSVECNCKCLSCSLDAYAHVKDFILDHTLTYWVLSIRMKPAPLLTVLIITYGVTKAQQHVPTGPKSDELKPDSSTQREPEDKSTKTDDIPYEVDSNSEKSEYQDIAN